MAIPNLPTRNPMDMALAPYIHIVKGVIFVVDLLVAVRLLVENHHVYSSLPEGAKMGMFSRTKYYCR
jgi:hypothetical protein